MGPSLFSNCVKILWNLKEIAQSNDDGSFGVNMEYYVIRVNTGRHLFKHLKIKRNYIIWKIIGEDKIWKIKERIKSRRSGFGFLSFRVLKSPGGRSHAGSGMVTTPKRRKYNSRHWETLRDPRKRILIYKSTQPHVFGLNWPIKLSDGPLSGALCQQGLLSSSTPPPQFDIAWLVGARGAKDAEITSRLAKHATSTFQTKWKLNSYFVFQQVLRCAFVILHDFFSRM